MFYYYSIAIHVLLDLHAVCSSCSYSQPTFAIARTRAHVPMAIHWPHGRMRDKRACTCMMHGGSMRLFQLCPGFCGAAWIWRHKAACRSTTILGKQTWFCGEKCGEVESVSNDMTGDRVSEGDLDSGRASVFLMANARSEVRWVGCI